MQVHVRRVPCEMTTKGECASVALSRTQTILLLQVLGSAVSTAPCGPVHVAQADRASRRLCGHGATCSSALRLGQAPEWSDASHALRHYGDVVPRCPEVLHQLWIDVSVRCRFFRESFPKTAVDFSMLIGQTTFDFSRILSQPALGFAKPINLCCFPELFPQGAAIRCDENQEFFCCHWTSLSALKKLHV